MKKAIASFAVGPQAGLHDVSLPTFARFARRHGYDLFVPSGTQFDGFSRHASWGKIPLILSLFATGYESVLWLDADVAVIADDRDILDDLPADAPMGLVVHQTTDGAVPNCGVWLLRSSAAEVLESLWPLDCFRRSSGWWEQAALIAALGGDPDATPVEVPAGRLWAEMPYEWNPHVRDFRGTAGCRFFHATCCHDRRAAMIEALTP